MSVQRICRTRSGAACSWFRHRHQGYFTFTVLGALPEPGASDPILQPTPVPAVDETPGTSPVSLEPGATLPVDLLALLRSMMLIGAAAAVGGWVFLSVALPLDGRDLVAPMRWMITGASTLLLIATLAFFATLTITVAGSLTPDAITAIARDTRLGQALVGRVALTLTFIGVMRFSSKWSPPAGIVIGGLILLTFSISGHAAATAQPLVSIAL
ncbi:MAG: copper resistance protein CopC, partial [Roseiflexaceae bacterium]|nr:copper resistance protein CopC [Roseiflexaceae bacterium]